MFPSLLRLAGTGLAIGCLTAPIGAREVTACGHHDYPPWNWEKSGEIVGACADVARNAFQRLGHTLNLSYVGPWKRCLALVKSGDVDVSICSFKTPERAAFARFVEVPMGLNPIAIFVKKGHEFQFDSWSDLAGRRSGVVDGVSMGAEFDHFLSTQTHKETVARPVLNLRKLEMERLDFVPLGMEAGLLQIRLYGFGNSIVPLPRPALLGKLYISISDHATDLHPQIPDIERYLSRPVYKDEITHLLRHYHEQYLREHLRSKDQETPD